MLFAEIKAIALEKPSVESVLARFWFLPPEAHETRNLFSVSGPFEIKLILHRASLFLYGVSAAEFCHFRMS